MSWHWPMVGRAEELAYLSRLNPGSGGPVGVVLAGPAGVGKTRLAREALAAAGRGGAMTRWVSATASSQSLPLGPFLRWAGPDGSKDRKALVRAALDGMTRGAGANGVMVGVDDAHLLDELSALLLHQLVLCRTARVVVTLRAGEPTPDAVRALWKDGLLVRLELQPLSRTESAELLESVLGGPLDSASANRLWGITQGNVLYLRQLVDGEREAARLAPAGGVWRWNGRPSLTPGLTELVEVRMGLLPSPVGDLLDVLALAEPLPLRVLAEVSSREAVERAESMKLVETVAGPDQTEVRLAHPLFGEVRLARCGPLRARRLRGQIATALTSLASKHAGDTLRLATLVIDSDLDPDPVLLAQAANAALGLLDFALAARLARAAVAAGAGFEAGRTLGFALSWSGRGAEADVALVELARSATSDVDRVRALFTRLGNLFFTLAQPLVAIEVLDELGRLVADPSTPMLVAWRSVVDAFLARPGAGLVGARQVLANTAAPPEVLALAGWGALTALAGLGKLAEARSITEQIEVAGPPGVTPVRVGAAHMGMRALKLAGELDEAAAWVERYQELLSDDLGGASLLHDVLRGEVARERGQVRTAIRLFRQAVTGLSGQDPGGWAYHINLQLTPTLAMAGEAPQARQALSEMAEQRHPSFGFLAPEAALAQAWVAAAEGVLSEAVTLARRAAELAASQHLPAVEVYVLHTAVCFGDRGCAERLAELADAVDGPRAGVAAAHAAALADSDGSGLLVVSRRLEAIGALLLAADAAAQAAEAFKEGGQRGSANLAMSRAQGLAQRCEDAQTPALRTLHNPLPLTEREREIVTLAAGGLTNREIAARLVVSVRTVEGHLYRAAAKLGGVNRAELAAILNGG